MTAAAQDTPVAVLTIEAVRWGLSRLRAQRIHPFFLAYLYLRKWSLEQGTATDIRPEWDELGEYLRVPGGPPGKPYYRPFWHGNVQDPSRYWLNPNIAGSYAPSSLRNVPYKVIDTHGSHFELKARHARLALDHLLFGERVSALAFAAFLYRDFGLVAAAQSLRPSALVLLLRNEFHYQADDDEFGLIFAPDATTSEVDTWFEPLDRDTPGVE